MKGRTGARPPLAGSAAIPTLTNAKSPYQTPEEEQEAREAAAAVERVNSRWDVSFGFEVHTIRGLKKMRMRSGLALIVMLAMALGRIRQQHPEHLRSLVWST